MNKKSIILFVLIPIFILDQITKLLVVKNFQLGESLPVINGIFHLTFVTNTGSAFGMFKGMNFVFIAIIGIVIGIILHQLKILKEKEKKSIFALSMLLAGALGNLTDRLIHGHVIDFFDFRIWPVFNIADSAITVSVIFLIIILWKKD